MHIKLRIVLLTMVLLIILSTCLDCDGAWIFPFNTRNTLIDMVKIYKEVL